MIYEFEMGKMDTEKLQRIYDSAMALKHELLDCSDDSELLQDALECLEDAIDCIAEAMDE